MGSDLGIIVLKEADLARDLLIGMCCSSRHGDTAAIELADKAAGMSAAYYELMQSRGWIRDATCEEFDNLSSMEKDAVFAARSWKDGRSTERPSEGYGGFVVP